MREKAERWWPNLLRAWLDGITDSFFPKAIPQIGRVKAGEKLAQFTEIRQEQDALHGQSKVVLSYGYALVWTTEGNRHVGQNDYIADIGIDTLADFLRLVGQETNYYLFIAAALHTRQRVPELEPWLRANPLRLLQNAPEWPNWLTICRFFLD